jgi:YggT family protein
VSYQPVSWFGNVTFDDKWVTFIVLRQDPCHVTVQAVQHADATLNFRACVAGQLIEILGAIMIELLSFVGYLVNLYEYVVIGSVVMSWLIAFNVVNLQNPLVRTIWQFLGAATEPLLKPIRRALPDMGGVDILLLGCLFIRSVVLPNIAKVFA